MPETLPTTRPVGILSGRHAVWLAAGCLTSVAVLVRVGVAGLPPAVAAPGLALIAGVDQATHRVPNRLLALTGTGAGIGAAWSNAAADGGLVPALTVAGAWLAVLLAVHVLDPGLGFGDVKLGGVLGFTLGWAAHTAGLDTATAARVSTIAFVAACVATLVASRRHAPQTAVPFAPGLVAATLLAVVVLVVAAPT